MSVLLHLMEFPDHRVLHLLHVQHNIRVVEDEEEDASQSQANHSLNNVCNPNLLGLCRYPI